MVWFEGADGNGKLHLEGGGGDVEQYLSDGLHLFGPAM